MEEWKKKYDDALKDMRVVYPNLKGEAKLAVEHAFPELAESEDERIRKELLEEIEFIIPHEDETDSEGLILPSYRTRIDKYSSYLEKQKEQNLADEQFPPLEGLDVIKAEYYDKGFSNGFDDGVDSVKPAEWGEEDERILKGIIGKIDHDQTYGVSKVEMLSFLKSLRPQSKADLDSIAKREYARGKQEGYWEGVKAERESCKTFHYESPNWPPKMPDLPTETTTNEGVSSIKPHWKPSEEQMEALDKAIPVCMGVAGRDEIAPLESLYEDLSKL